MLGRLRVRKAHARFLESCRNLREGRDYWKGIGQIRSWLVNALVPIPVLGLHEEGMKILSALNWLEYHCRQQAISEDIIRYYHVLVCGEAANQPAGCYRKHRITIVGSPIPRPPPEKVRPLMMQLAIRLVQEQGRLDRVASPEESEVLKVAVELYHRLSSIHPFQDGNGRVARLAMNHLMRRYGQGYVILPPLCEPTSLWDALECANRGTIGDLVALAQSCVYRI